MTAVDCILRKMDELGAAKFAGRAARDMTAVKREVQEAVEQAKLDGQSSLDLQGGSFNEVVVSEKALKIFQRKGELKRRRDLITLMAQRDIAARLSISAPATAGLSLARAFSHITSDMSGRAGGRTREVNRR